MAKRDKPLHWDMSFDEALRRVAQTDPRELPAPHTAKKKRKVERPKADRSTPTRQDRPQPE